MDSVLPFSATSLAVSGVVTIGLVVQAVRFRKNLSLYGLAIAAGLSLFIGSALNLGLESADTYYYYKSAVHIMMAGYWFITVFPPLLWSVAFDTFRTVHSAAVASDDQGTKKFPSLQPSLAFTALGYVWVFIIVICAIVVAAWTTNVEGGGGRALLRGIDAFNTEQFAAYGLWAFVVFFAGQFYLSYSYIQPFLKSFALYVFLLLIVVIGQTVVMATGMYGYGLAGVVVGFVLVRLFGCFALLVVVFFGHRWVFDRSDHAGDQPGDAGAVGASSQPGSSGAQNKVEVP